MPDHWLSPGDVTDVVSTEDASVFGFATKRENTQMLIREKFSKCFTVCRIGRTDLLKMFKSYRNLQV